LPGLRSVLPRTDRDLDLLGLPKRSELGGNDELPEF
jgi:hypothetical protein